MKEIHIVEDDNGIREMLEFLLVSENYAVKTFPNVRSFYKSFPDSKPDLFLLDIMLPDGSGLDLCKAIKNGENTLNIPVILMSAHIDAKRRMGADFFIPKPFDIEQLMQVIHHQVGNNV